MNFQRELKKYDYKFPAELIAQKPANPRSSARLLIYDRKSRKSNLGTFADLEAFLPIRSVIVLNRTKVIPARLTVFKSTGGRVKLLFLEKNGKMLNFLSDRVLTSGMRLSRGKVFHFDVISRRDKIYSLRPSFRISDIGRILERYGSTPIPPYIKDTPLKERELRTQYQSIFARKAGSVAAPTASLHFDKKILNRLKEAGHEILYVTLHVGLGTFAPLTKYNLSEGHLHVEQYSIDKKVAERLNRLKKSGHPIVAVGTTVVRTLESACNNSKTLVRLSGETDIFIKPRYDFRFIDALITNFHVPGSSLLMLVSAFCGRTKLLGLYKKSIKAGLRLFSFGDGMLIK